MIWSWFMYVLMDLTIHYKASKHFYFWDALYFVVPEFLGGISRISGRKCGAGFSSAATT